MVPSDAGAHRRSMELAFAFAAALTFLIQSPNAICIFAIGLLGAEAPTVEQTLMVFYGAGIGSGGLLCLLSSGLTGRSRQIAMYMVLEPCTAGLERRWPRSLFTAGAGEDPLARVRQEDAQVVQNLAVYFSGRARRCLVAPLREASHAASLTTSGALWTPCPYGGTPARSRRASPCATQHRLLMALEDALGGAEHAAWCTRSISGTARLHAGALEGVGDPPSGHEQGHRGHAHDRGSAAHFLIWTSSAAEFHGRACGNGVAPDSSPAAWPRRTLHRSCPLSP